MPGGQSDQISELIEQADIVRVAQNLGLQIDARKRQPRRAICPFHNDKDPSLHLYHREQGQNRRDHYHCFVCGAHGDAVKLVQEYEHLTFMEAVQRLAQIEGVTLSQRPSGPSRSTGLDAVSQIINTSKTQHDQFEVYATQRGYAPAWLRQRGIGIANLDPLLQTAKKDRTFEEGLVVAGLARQIDVDPNARQLFAQNIKPLFYGDRILFPIENMDGKSIAFAARSLGDAKPKYLFSYDFPKSETLYRGASVRRAIEASASSPKSVPADVYIVEGVFDALRLEQLGLNAVAVLGSHITVRQVNNLQTLIAAATNIKRDVRLHLLLDSDEAGWRGAYDGTIALLKLLETSPPFEFDIVVLPRENAQKADPDGAFLGMVASDARAKIAENRRSVFGFLAAYKLSVDPTKEVAWNSITPLSMASTAREIAVAANITALDKIFIPLLKEVQNDKALSEFGSLVRIYSDKTTAPRAIPTVGLGREESDDHSLLMRASTIGHSSCSRREYPSDEAAWDRLNKAASSFYHLHKARLADADGPSAPLLVREIPKGHGKYRRKSGLQAEDVLLQQYMLIELLRDRPACPEFAAHIPAVRYDGTRPRGSTLYTTGASYGGQPITGEKPVSFAYQIDMGIVNGDVPPRREGIFRPYFDCWRDFILCIEEQIKRFASNEMQILRLDISGYYDNIRRDAMQDAITNKLGIALEHLPASSDGAKAFAPLFKPGTGNAIERAEEAAKFFMVHSFGIDSMDPSDGSQKKGDQRKGIPQGPDLSAYLANIALFDLDAMVVAEIDRLNQLDAEQSGEDKIHAAYARYVDDIVLVCSNIETASQLRRKIEASLAVLGLSLNRKNPTPPPMSREEARAWISDNRAGFGFSGPLADLPTTDAMDPLAEAGEIDRRTSLGMLHDPELDNPANLEKSLETIRTALRASDLRFNDRANAYRRLWVYAANEEAGSSKDDLVNRFVNFLERVEPLTLISAPAAKRDFLTAVLEGLERALRLSPSTDLMSAKVRADIIARIGRITSAVLDDIFTTIAVRLMGGSASTEWLGRYDVRMQIAIMVRFAADRVSEFTNEPPSLSEVRKHIDENKPALDSGLRWSLHRFDPAIEGDRPSLLVARREASLVAFQRLHGAIVKLQRLARDGNRDNELSTASEEDAQVPILLAASKTLRIWTPDVPNEENNPVERIEFDAATTLINLTYRRFSEIAERRPRLVALIANRTDAMAIPSPPGLNFNGIMLWCEKEQQLLLATANNAEIFPDGATWASTDTEIQGIELFQADLPDGCKPLFKNKVEWLPSRIAQTYREFFPVWRNLYDPAGDKIPIPTVFSFFAATDANDGRQNHRMICWSAPRSSVDGHAFVRNGDALEATTVFADGADYWRFGWALCDLCDRKEEPADEGWLDAQATTPLTNERHRREALLTRVLPRLSGSDRFGPGQQDAGAIPTRIARGLRILEKFGQNAISDDAAYLVAAIAEGMFMSERLNAPSLSNINGAPAALLVRASRRAMRALPEAAAHWPRPAKTVAPGRHHAAAWFAVAARIKERMGALEPSSAAALGALASGADILGTVADLQSLAFELAGGLDATTFELLEKSGFEHAWITSIVGDDIIFVEDEKNLNTSVGPQTHRLVQIFCSIVLGQRTGLSSLRDRIAPAGWVALVAILLQVIEVHKSSEINRSDKSKINRPALWKMDFERRERAADALRILLSFLGLSGPEKEELEVWPWGIFAQLQAEQPDHISLLRNITGAAAINIPLETTQYNPRSGDGSATRETIRLSDGTTKSIHDWQVAVAYLRGERGKTLEQYEDDDKGVRYRYSIARADEKLLAVHLVSRQLARLAFGDTLEPIAEATNNDVISGADRGINAATSKMHSASEDAVTPEATTETLVREGAHKSSGAPASPNSENESLARIRHIQREAWKKRASERHHGARRVAIAQWDVTDTYHSPGYKDGKSEGLLLHDKPVEHDDISEGGNFVSTTENRRRAILRAILNACYEFGVEGLVLPEYSVRPETVNWLSRQLSQGEKALTIWCGTFRVPGGTRLELVEGSPQPYGKPVVFPTPTGRVPYDAHSALLTCLRAIFTSGNALKVSTTMRRKRYPSSAAGELIRPPLNDPWRPLLTDISYPFDVGAYTLELICSEMFPHASSANFVGVIAENEALARRYNLPPDAIAPFEYLTYDIYEFAKWTSHRSSPSVLEDKTEQLTRGKSLQRTLIILPAMTSRSADYHIFGQNQYLAAGLVTAFVNAVEPTYGCGQSCFIGLDGWQLGAEPPASPYSGIAPGIFQLNGKATGPLGKKEAAIVIADLDLVRTTDQKPRPHYQERAIRLVAHLPLIFETETVGRADGEDASHGRRIDRKRSVDGLSLISFDAVASLIEAGLVADGNFRAEVAPLEHDVSQTDKYKADIEAIKKALDLLSLFADDPQWLSKRRNAFVKNQCELPGVRPLPALIDWIYVRDRWQPKVNYSEKTPLSNDDPLLSVPRAQGELPRKPS